MPATSDPIAPLRVSVVIPAYNAARFLPQAIAGLRAQTRPVDEILIVDDGSKDDTAQVVAGLGEGITYIRQDNAGVSAARNKGIAEATGDLVAFLDADDFWLPEKLEKQLAVFRRHPGVGLVASDRCDVDAEDHVLLASLFERQGLAGEFRNLAGAPLPQALSRLVRTNFLPTSSVMVRKAALDDVGVFETAIRYGEDLELWARIAAKYGVVCLPEVLVRYRLHDSNATQHTERLLRDMVRVMERIRDWGRPQLKNEGVEADALVANALWELGYWYFQSEQPDRARAPMLASLKARPGARALAYACLSLLPGGAIRSLREFKRRLTD